MLRSIAGHVRVNSKPNLVCYGSAMVRTSVMGVITPVNFGDLIYVGSGIPG